MANVVASILATLGLDKTGFTTGLGQAEREAQARAATIKSALGGIGLGLGVAGLSASLKSIIDYGAEVQHLSDRFGVSTDAIQRFGNAAEQNGVSMESVARAFNKLEIAQAKALQGDDEITGAFVALGVSVGDLKTLSPDQIMEKLGHSSLNAADMVKILGRNGLELRPILEGLANGTIDFGKVIDRIDIKRLEEADKILIRLVEEFRLHGAEAVSDLTSRFTGDAAAIKSRWAEVADVFGKLVKGRISEANEAAKEFTKNFSFIGALKGVLFGVKAPPPVAPTETKKTPADLEEESKAALKTELVRGQNAVLSAQLDHLDDIARALEIHLNIEKKIADARSAGNSALVTQLQLEERLSIQKIAQDVAEKNQQRTKLTLKELAEAGPLEGSRYSSEATLRARRALQEQAAGERERLAQHPEEAARHFQLAEQIKLDIPQLRDSEKDISGQVRAGVDSSSVFQDIKGKMDTILNLFQG